MVKSRADVEKKMRDRVGTAGQYLKDGMTAAVDPVDVLLKDPEAAAKRMTDGLADAVRRGSYRVGLERAKQRNSWKNSVGRAATHFEERKDDMVKNAMDSYDARAGAIAAAKARTDGMPVATRDQRIAKSMAYLKAVGEEMDKVFGRK